MGGIPPKPSGKFVTKTRCPSAPEAPTTDPMTGTLPRMLPSRFEPSPAIPETRLLPNRNEPALFAANPTRRKSRSCDGRPIHALPISLTAGMTSSLTIVPTVRAAPPAALKKPTMSFS